MFRSASNRQPKAACPTEQELVGLLNGSGNDDQQAVESHVEGCVSCQEKLDQLTNPVADEAMSDQQKKLWNKVFETDGERPGSSHALLNSALASRPRMTERSKGDDSSIAQVPTIAGYEFREQIAGGAMGSVYRAWHLKLGRDVAIKLMRPSVDPRRLALFEQEMTAVGGLSSRNIVHAYDAGEADGIPYIVMELVDGHDLGECVESSGDILGLPEAADRELLLAAETEQPRKRLSVSEACECVRQAASGLQAAHEAGVIHRDVKPSNLMLTSDGVVKVLDLGLATIQYADEVDAPDHDQACIMGSLDYLAPEQARDPSGVDARTDIYGLGCTLFALLTGRPPFVGEKYVTASQKLLAHATEPRPDVRHLNPAVPGRLSNLVARMMSPDPSMRPESADAVRELLTQYCPDRRQRNPAAVVGAAAVIAGLLILMAVAIDYFGRTRVDNDTLASPTSVISAPEGTTAPVWAADITYVETPVQDEFPGLVFTLDLRPDLVAGHCFGVSGDEVFTVSMDGQVVRWDLETARSETVYRFETERASGGVAVSPDGAVLYFANSDGLMKLRLASRELDWSVDGARNLWCFELPDSELLLHGRQGSLFLRNAVDGASVQQVRFASDHVPSLSNDGLRAAITKRRSDECIVFDPRQLADREAVVSYRADDFNPSVVQFSPNGKHLIALGGSDTVVWDVETGEVVQRYHTPNHRPQRFLIPVASTGRFLTVRGQLQDELIVWDPLTNTIDRIISVPPAYRVSVSRDGTRALTSDFLTDRNIYGGNVHVWELVGEE